MATDTLPSPAQRRVWFFLPNTQLILTSVVCLLVVVLLRSNSALQESFSRIQIPVVRIKRQNWFEMLPDAKDIEPTIKPGTFVYLVMAKNTTERKWQARSRWPDSAVIFLLWGKNVTDRPRMFPEDQRRLRVIHDPNTTWASGRNAMVREAKLLEKEQGWLFEFFMMFDGDVFLSYRKEKKPRKVIVKKSDDDALRSLTRLLLRDRPMRAGVGFNPFTDLGHEHSSKVNFGCTRKCHFDPDVSAYHRTGVDVLLPYTERYDDWSWFAPNILSDVFASAVTPIFCAVYYEVLVELKRQQHGKYPKGRVEDLHKVVSDVNACLARAHYRDFQLDSPLSHVNTKLAGGMGFCPGLHIGDHYIKVGERKCFSARPGVNYSRILGDEQSHLWAKHCLLR